MRAHPAAQREWRGLVAEPGERDAAIAPGYAPRFDASRAQTHRALGAVLFDAGRLDDALECFARAQALDAGLAAARSPPHR